MKFRKFMAENNEPDILKMDVALFLRLLEFAKEDAKQDVDLHFVTEKAVKLCRSEKVLSMQDYDSIVPPKQTEPQTSEVSPGTTTVDLSVPITK